MDDAALVLAARAGDRGAFAALIDRHYAVLVACCRRALRDPADAADIAQEAVVVALLGLERLRRPEAFGPWLVGIGLNLARRAGRAALPLDAIGEPAADGPDPVELAEASLAAERVRAAIAELPPGQRDAVTLFYLAGLSAPEVATELASTHGAVKTRLHKARATLRVRLSDLREESEMVPMRIADIRAGDRHVVLLEERDGTRRLPIWIGGAEAMALAMRLDAVELPRPGTYDLTGELLRACGTSVREVRIVRLTDRVFYAQVVLDGGAEVDARPSDALNLALVADAPILVDERVIAASAADDPRLAPDLAAPRDARRLADEGRAELAEDRRRLDELRAG
jgi:RNA polymerase sigma factor (sigma-70 family)